MTRFNLESGFDETMKEIAPLLQRFNDYDLVIGIPFLDEQERLVTLLRSVDNVLESWIDRRQLIVCVGDISAGDSLQGIKELNLKHPHIEFLMPPELSGRGMSVRLFWKYLNTWMLIYYCLVLAWLARGRKPKNTGWIVF